MDDGQYHKLPCICMRKPYKIECLNPRCTFTSYQGRTRKGCPSHPKLTFLMDLVLCPLCLSECEEFDENGGVFDARKQEEQPEEQASNRYRVVLEDRLRFRPHLNRRPQAPRTPGQKHKSKLKNT